MGRQAVARRRDESEISTKVVSNVQMLHEGGARRRGEFFQAYSPKNNACLVVMMIALAVPLVTYDVVAEAGDGCRRDREEVT